jgi:hypothetical protein
VGQRPLIEAKRSGRLGVVGLDPLGQAGCAGIIDVLGNRAVLDAVDSLVDGSERYQKPLARPNRIAMTPVRSERSGQLRG